MPRQKHQDHPLVKPLPDVHVGEYSAVLFPVNCFPTNLCELVNLLRGGRSLTRGGFAQGTSAENLEVIYCRLRFLLGKELRGL